MEVIRQKESLSELRSAVWCSQTGPGEAACEESGASAVTAPEKGCKLSPGYIFDTRRFMVYALGREGRQ